VDDLYKGLLLVCVSSFSILVISGDLQKL